MRRARRNAANQALPGGAGCRAQRGGEAAPDPRAACARRARPGNQVRPPHGRRQANKHTQNNASSNAGGINAPGKQAAATRRVWALSRSVACAATEPPAAALPRHASVPPRPRRRANAAPVLQPSSSRAVNRPARRGARAAAPHVFLGWSRAALAGRGMEDAGVAMQCSNQLPPPLRPSSAPAKQQRFESPALAWGTGHGGYHSPLPSPLPPPRDGAPPPERRRSTRVWDGSAGFDAPATQPAGRGTGSKQSAVVR
jgi:hypothetical protein